MKVKDVMTRRVVTVGLSAPLREIYRILCEKNIGGVPVTDDKGRLLGMITKTELIDVLIPDYFDMIGDFLFIDDLGALEEKLEFMPSLELFIAEDLMVVTVISISENASLMKAPLLMSKYNVRRLPVVKDDNELVGIITRMDVCKALFNRKAAQK